MSIELNKVYTLKLSNADEIVAKIIAEDETAYTVEQPLSAIPTDKGIQLVFAIFTADPAQNITINKSAVVMTCAVREEVADHYLEATTGIKPIRNSKILMG